MSLSLHERSGLARSGRVAAVRRAVGQFGLDHADIEIAGEHLGADSTTLRLVFVTDDSGAGCPIPPGLSPAKLTVTEGPRDLPASIRPVSVSPGGVAEEVVVGLEAAVPWTELDPGMVLRVTLVGVPGVDPALASARFGLAPADRPAAPQPAPVAVMGQLDRPHSYLAKDYASFRQLLVERMRLTVPEWREESAADVTVTLLEGVAHLADQLSYFQDAVGTEAYLGTARFRRSIRRHARLLGPQAMEGCGARLWLRFEVDEVLDLPEGVVVGTADGDRRDEGVDFRTVEAGSLAPGRNAFPLHDWGISPFTIERGATEAALAGHVDVRRSDVLVFEQRSPSGGAVARHAVRIATEPVRTDDGQHGPITRIRWYGADALPFPVRVVAEAGGPALARVLGNVVAADQGRFERVRPDALSWQGSELRVRTRGRPLLHHVPWRPERLVARSATEAMLQDPSEACPGAVIIERRPDGRPRIWSARPDLLASGPFDRHFVVEVDDQRDLWIRFGDGTLGRRAPDPRRVELLCRLGAGVRGNVAEDSVLHAARPVDGVRRVHNPLPGRAGQAPLPLERVLQAAVSGLQRPGRCVIDEDYVAMTRRHPMVADAAARIRWTGSWPVATVWVLPAPGVRFDDLLAAELEEHLRPFATLGVRVEVRAVPPVHLDVEVLVHATRREAAAGLERRICQDLSDQADADGQPGFLHPTRWGLGQPVYESQILSRLARLPDVAWAEVVRLQRVDRDAERHEPGQVPVEPHEVVRPGGPRPIVVRVEAP